MNKDTQLLTEAYESILNNKKEIYYKNLYNRFMDQTENRNMQGFDLWFSEQLRTSWMRNQDLLQQFQAFVSEGLFLENPEDLKDDLICFVQSRIGTDQRSYDIEA